MPQTIRVTADDRERGGGGVAALRAGEDVAVCVERLECGDYRVRGRSGGGALLFERKTLPDLSASIWDGRLFRQAVRLRQATSRRCERSRIVGSRRRGIATLGVRVGTSRCTARRSISASFRRNRPIFVMAQQATDQKATDQQATKWFGMRLTPAQKAKIERLAEQQGSTQKDAVMRVVEAAVIEEEEPIEAQPGSILALSRDLCGSIDDPDVPTDLSSNPKHMEDYGKD